MWSSSPWAGPVGVGWAVMASGQRVSRSAWRRFRRPTSGCAWRGPRTWRAGTAKPIKGVAWHAGKLTSRGEAVISATGLEGGGIYSVSRAVREGAPLAVDLLPDLSPEAVGERLAAQDPKASLATRLRKAVGLTGARAALLNEFGRPFGADMARMLKALPIRHAGLMPMDDAISTAGGLRFDALDGFRLKGHDHVYASGEMLDWEAPTGGWLITACLATGRAAALQALEEMGVARGPEDEPLARG